MFLKFQHLFLAVHQLVGTVLHGVGQGFLLLGQFRFACVQLGLGVIQLLLGIVQLLFRLGKFLLGLGLLVIVGLTGLGQLLVGGVDKLFPTLHTLGGADLLPADPPPGPPPPGTPGNNYHTDRHFPS